MIQRRINRSRDQGDALVLALLAIDTKALSVYQIRDLAAARGERIAPMQVYRIVQRLIADGKVRRIEALSAYMRAEQCGDAVAICRLCRTCQSLPFDGTAFDLRGGIVADDFAVDRLVIEVIGLCGRCLT